MIGLLKSPLAIAAAVLLFVAIVAHQTGARGERARGEAATLRTELATLRADRASAEQSARSATAKAAELEAITNRQEIELDALRTQLNALPADARQLAPADALDRLYGRH